jgi:multidrug efflux pump subunit AcrA (membrane-fusion protein)
MDAPDEFDDFLDDGNHSRRNRFIVLALFATVAVGVAFALWATLLRGGDSAAGAVQTVEVQRGSIVQTISTSATTASQSTANLSFSASGRVTAVNVTIGQEVKQGDVLAEVEATALENALIRAQVNLSSAQTKLGQLLEGATTAEIASADQSVIQAEANLDKANAALEDLFDGPTAEERDTAQQAVLAAESQLAKSKTARANVDSAWSDAVAAAEQAVQKAETALEDAEQAAEDAADNLTLAEAKLTGAETAYCACDSSPSFCASPDAPLSAADESDLLAVVSDGTAPCNMQASSALTANSAYNNARLAEKNAEDSVDQANEELQAAEDNLDELGAGPSSDDIASADMAVVSAELALKMANDKLAELDQGPSEDDVMQAQYNVDSAAAALTAAEAKLDETYRGAEDEEISSQRDQVRLAQLAVSEAEKDLEKAQIIAPFDGTVAALNVTVGDTAGSSAASTSTSSGTSAAIVLNTPNALILNVSIGESDLPSVKAGQSGTATFDAISGQVFPIVIDSVGTNPTTTQGVVTYQARARIVSRDSAAASGTWPSGNLTSEQQQTIQERLAEGSLTAEQRQAIEARMAGSAAGSETAATAQPAPGMNASVTIIVDQRQDVLTVATSAVQTEGRASFVTVQNEDGSTERVVVEIGLSDDTNTEITSGLEEGQTVIIPGVTSTSSSAEQNTSQQVSPIFGGPPGDFQMPVGPGGGTAR